MINFYSFRQLVLFSAFLVGVVFLTGCASDDGGGDNNRLPSLELEFSPYDGGTYVYWSNWNTSAALESLNITSINITAIGYDSDGDEQHRETKIFTVDQLASLTIVRQNGDHGYDFTGLQSGLDYAFELSITIGDGSPRAVGITPAEANRVDYEEDKRIGIGEDADNNQVADFVDLRRKDSDNDGINDNEDSCINSVNSVFTSTSTNDRDGDGCEDAREDIDDDGDGLIEIFGASDTVLATPSLDHMRYQLDGTALTNSTGNTTSSGCGGRENIRACSGYELMNDIMADNWDPIGSDSDSNDGLCLGDDAFTAIFEGNGYAITLQDIALADDCVGFFAQLKDAQIRNLNISAENIRGTKNVGVLAGWGQNTVITNVHTKSMSLKGVQAVGGLIGRIQSDDGSDAVAQAESSGDTLPIVAELATEPSIKDSSAKSNEILACASAGGLVGESDRIMIEDSYAINKRIELPFNRTFERELLGFDCNTVRAGDTITHHIYKSIGGLVGDGDSSLWKGDGWSAAPNLEEHIVINIGDYTSGSDTKYPNDGVSTTTYGDLGLTKVVEGGTRVVSSYAISGNLTGNWKIAGLVGDLQNGEATNSYAITKNIQARIRTAGGLIGQGDNTDIVTSYAIAGLINASGSVTGQSDGDKANGEAGGLVGRARVVIVNASYAVSGSIMGGKDGSRAHLGSAAGLLGSRVLMDMDDSIDIKIENSYVSFDRIVGAKINPFVGRDTLTNVAIDHSYWNTNATSLKLGNSINQMERLYITEDSSENPNAKVQGSLTTGEEIVNPKAEPGEEVYTSGSDIFSEWKGIDSCWDFGTDTEYPAIDCTPDQPADQRQWYDFIKFTYQEGPFDSFYLGRRKIQVRTDSIDQRINNELN